MDGSLGFGRRSEAHEHPGRAPPVRVGVSRCDARCAVTYGRQRCVPFQSGVEGARCTLDEGHAGRHLARIVVQFGNTHEENILGDFWFEERMAVEPLMTAQEAQSIYDNVMGLYEKETD